MNDNVFSVAFRQPAGSPIRELFPYLSRPGMISFAGGYPTPGLFDAEGLQEAAAKALAQPAVLQYGATEGQVGLRGALVLLCAQRGIRADVGEILVTTGSQQGFDLLVRVLLNPGDIALIETPAYPAALQALRLAGAALVAVPTDSDGIDTEKLREILQGLAPGQKPKLLYTVPNYSNPGGSLLSAGRRQALLALAMEHGFLIIEDDPYGELRFTEQVESPLYSLGQARLPAANPVIYLSSLSKTVAPALRIGWMLASPEILRRCVVAKQTVDLCTSPLAQMVAAEYLGLDRYAGAVARARAEYGRRAACMAEELARVMGGQVKYSVPRGGMFLWLELVAPVDTQRLFEAAVARNVVYVPGSAFFPDGGAHQGVRLSFASPAVDDIREGVKRLGQALVASRTSENVAVGARCD